MELFAKLLVLLGLLTLMTGVISSCAEVVESLAHRNGEYAVYFALKGVVTAVLSALLIVAGIALGALSG